MLTRAPKGTDDIFGDEMRIWRYLEMQLREISGLFGFSEIRTPIFEHTELFLRGVGETTDVVQKEMYNFVDKGGRNVSLRPEMTAGVARAYVEHGMHVQQQPTKLFYIGPNFRYERPQAGRTRQHHQFGVELFGINGAAAEAEVLSLGYTILQKLKIRDVVLHINSIGCADCRRTYQARLKSFLGDNLQKLCPTCQNRFEKNPLRTLDCKVAECQEILKDAPSVLESLDDACRTHFENLQSMLKAMDIPFVVDSKVVRGLDYYTQTVFEFIGEGQTVIGGGRYDNLIAECGGAPTAAVGFGMGIERLILRIKKQSDSLEEYRLQNPIALFIGHIGYEGLLEAQKLTYRLRTAGFAVVDDPLDRSVKAQMKYADKLGARYAMVVGGDEIANKQANVKNMQTGEQEMVPFDKLEDYL